jgi:Glycosyl hydrolases family 16
LDLMSVLLMIVGIAITYVTFRPYPAMSRMRVLARLRVPKHPTFEFAFGLEPIIQLTAWLFAAFEIDFVCATVMENIGKEPAIIHGSIHGPGYIGDTGIEAPYKLPAKRFADDFHIFAVEWDADSVSFYVDQNLYVRRTRADLQPGWKWVFDKPFFLILNLAVGGDWPGNPDSATVFPQAMLVDYVRVYQRSEPAKKDSARP